MSRNRALHRLGLVLLVAPTVGAIAFALYYLGWEASLVGFGCSLALLSWVVLVAWLISKKPLS